ncbi:MAG: hypothetical protein ABIH74_00555, partial [Candidatus Omnitrophota bacterium]
GCVPLELEHVLEIFYNALTDLGEDPAAWVVRVYAMDATDKYIPVTKDAVAGHIFTETLQTAGISTDKKPDLKIFPVNLNVMDSDGMQALLRHSGRRPDYFFMRRLLYVTDYYERGDFFSGRNLWSLEKYIAINNVFSTAKPGTRIVLESSASILTGEAPYMSDFNPAPEGAEVLERGMGVLKVTDPDAFSQTLKDFLKGIDAGTNEQTRRRWKDIRDSIKESNHTRMKKAFPGVVTDAAPEDAKRNAAQGFIDAVFCREFETRNDPQKERIVIALDTGWIKGYEKGAPQFNFLNPVFTAMRKFCASRGISFITASSEDLIRAVNDEKDRLGAGTKTIILSGMDAVLSDDFKPFRDDADTFLVGIDDMYLTEDCDMRIEDMMKLALKHVFGLARREGDPDITVQACEGFSNVFIFIPKPGPLIEECAEMYQLHRQAFHTAA